MGYINNSPAAQVRILLVSDPFNWRSARFLKFYTPPFSRNRFHIYSANYTHRLRAKTILLHPKYTMWIDHFCTISSKSCWLWPRVPPHQFGHLVFFQNFTRPPAGVSLGYFQLRLEELFPEHKVLTARPGFLGLLVSALPPDGDVYLDRKLLGEVRC